MSLLSTADIAAMRATAAQTFAGTAIIHSGTIVSDGGGGGTAAFAPRVGGTVGCHLSPIVARGEGEPVESDRISVDADWVLTLPAETTIARSDRVVVSAITYEVQALRAPRTWELTRRVELAEVT